MAANKEPNEGNSQANKKSGVAGYVKNLERGIMLFDNNKKTNELFFDSRNVAEWSKAMDCKSIE